MKIVLSTKNKGKITELSLALKPLNKVIGAKIEWLSMDSLNIKSPIENQGTFIENALLKARHSSHCSKLPALADDSGLCISALNNQPGVYSARYAGENASDQDNYLKVLKNMRNITDRSAFFYCVIAYVDHPLDPTPIIAQGYWHGNILNQAEGEQGFGYDPIFQGEGLNTSAALLSKQEKLAHSHRGQAINNFIAQWQKQYKTI